MWVSLSAENFERYKAMFDEENPQEPSYFGWLCNHINGYPDTLCLKTNVTLQPYPSRPHIHLEPTDHPLAKAQREGITMDELMAVLHTHGAFDGG